MSNLPPLLLVPAPLPTAAPDGKKPIVPKPKGKSRSTSLLENLPDELQTNIWESVFERDLADLPNYYVKDLCRLFGQICQKSPPDGGHLFHPMCIDPDSTAWVAGCKYFGVKKQFKENGQSGDLMTWRKTFFKLCSMFQWHLNPSHMLQGGDRIERLRPLLVAHNDNTFLRERPPNLEDYSKPPGVKDEDWTQMVENSKALVSKLLVLANAKWGLKRHFKDVRAFLEGHINVQEMLDYLGQMETQSGVSNMEQANIAKFENMTSGQALEKHLWTLLSPIYEVPESDIRYGYFPALPVEYRTQHLIKITRFAIASGVDLEVLGFMMLSLVHLRGDDMGKGIAECFNLLLDFGMGPEFLYFRSPFTPEVYHWYIKPTSDPQEPPPRGIDQLIGWIMLSSRGTNGMMEFLVRLFRKTTKEFEFESSKFLSVFKTIRRYTRKISKGYFFNPQAIRWESDAVGPDDIFTALTKFDDLCDALIVYYDPHRDGTDMKGAKLLCAESKANIRTTLELIRDEKWVRGQQSLDDLDSEEDGAEEDGAEEDGAEENDSEEDDSE